MKFPWGGIGWSLRLCVRPRPGYVPKVLSTSFRSQVVTFFRGVLLEDICVAAGWSSLHTFIRFYNLDLDTAPGSQVLSVWTGRECFWFVIGPGRAVFLGWHVWYIVPKVSKLYAASSEPMKENVSGYSCNPCSLNRERDAAFAAEQVPRVASAPSANELAWFCTGFRQSARPGAFPKCVGFTKLLVPYSENKDYANNPRRFHVSKCKKSIYRRLHSIQVYHCSQGLFGIESLKLMN